MLYVIYGEDFKKSRANLKGLTNALLKKKPDSNLFRLDDSNFSPAKLEEFIGSQGLFEQKYIVLLDKCLESKEIKAEVINKLKEMASSDNIFICVEEKIDKKTLTKLEKYTEKLYVYNKSDNQTKEIPKLFSLTDALGTKDKKKIWVEYQKALMNGFSAEEIHSMLLWQIRSMLLTGHTKNAKEAGLKPFVYTKSKKFSQNYSGNEINTIYTNLIVSYHEARRGSFSLEEGIEEVILNL